MTRNLSAFLAITCAGCGTVKNQTADASAVAGDAPTAIDAASGGTDSATTTRCDPTKPFDAPTLVPNINTSNDEIAFGLTRDELTGFISNVILPPSQSATIAVTTRASDSARFGAPNRVATNAINATTGEEFGPSPVSDGLTLYFHRQVNSLIAVLAATRVDAESTFSQGSGITVDGTQLLDGMNPHISDDGQTLYWLDFGDDFHLHSATRGTSPTVFTTERAASTISFGNPPVLSVDELTLFYADGNNDNILESKRTSKADAFGNGVPLANINSPQNEFPLFLTRDGCVLYLASNRPGGLGGFDIWEAHRPR